MQAACDRENGGRKDGKVLIGRHWEIEKSESRKKGIETLISAVSSSYECRINLYFRNIAKAIVFVQYFIV
jgi:hypothetical protein